MNKCTIILLASLVTLIQITNAHPIVVTPKNNDSDNNSDNSPKDNNKHVNHTPEDCSEHDKPAPEPKPVVVPKLSVESDESNGGEVTNYYNMEDFVKQTIRSHLGDNMEFESMSDETEQQLYDMFCEMNMI